MQRYMLRNGAWIPLRSDVMQTMNGGAGQDGQIMRTDLSASPVPTSGSFTFNQMSLVMTDVELAAQQAANLAAGALVIDVRGYLIYKYSQTSGTWTADSADSITNYIDQGLHYFNPTTGKLFFADTTSTLVYIGHRGVAAATNAEAIAGVRTDVAVTSTQAKLAWQTWKGA